MQQPDLIHIPTRSDARGDLFVIEASELTGFDFRRLFYFKAGADPLLVRGGHAHKQLAQFIVCVAGSVRIAVEDAAGKCVVTLDDPAKGLLARPLTWVVLDQFSPDATVIVCASDSYLESDYIRDYAEFQKALTMPTAEPIEYAPMKRMAQESRAALIAACTGVIDSGWYIGGPTVEKFEREFAEWCGARYAISCGNGLDALALILEAYGIGPGDEVIVPANSCIATALAVNMVGARPVLVDCRADTYGIDANLIEAAITPRTRAVIPVHLYGIPADMTAVMDIAARHDLKVIEDSAQGHGSLHEGRKAGTLGHAAAFSFYPTKNLGALGDGGCVTTDDAELAQRVRLFANYGATRRYYHEVKGRNSRLDPMQAAMLSAKLPTLDASNARRRELAALYYDAFKNRADITLPVIPNDVTPVWHIFPLGVAPGKRDALIKHLGDDHIGTLVHYPVPIHLQQAYDGDFPGASFPESERSANALISLPLTPWHTDEEIARVAASVIRFLEAA